MRTDPSGLTALRRVVAVAWRAPGRPLVGIALLFGLLGLAACGSYSANQTNHETPGATKGPATASPGTQSSYAYLYSRIDYPLQIPVNGSDTVSLVLSPFSSILTVAPTSGTGSTTFSEPIPLPTDLQNYQDSGASVDTLQPSGPAPLAWQLTSAPRQSLLAPVGDGARAYRNSVTFHWQVRAMAAGENTTQIEMTIYYIYLDGSEHDGTLQVSQSPIPIVGVSVSAAQKTLPPLRLPIAGLTGLAGMLAFLRFFWGAYRTVKDAADTGRDAAKVAHTIQRRVGQQPAGTPAAPPTAAQRETARTRIIVGEPTEPADSTDAGRRKGGRLWPPSHSR